MRLIDEFLNKITMYRLVLYFLLLLIAVSIILSFFGLLPYKPLEIVISAAIIFLTCWISNTIFSLVYKAPTNIESVYITAGILTLIISPTSPLSIPLLLWISILSMASKYILTVHQKHIFNPVAIAAVVTALGIQQSASWWVGSKYLFPLVFIGGLLIIRKIKREELFISFFITVLVIITGLSLVNGVSIINNLDQVFFHSSLFFFAFVMLTEPLTTPPTKKLQVFYGALVGALFLPQVHIGSLYSTPEIALIIGNVFSYLVSPKLKLFLRLKEKIRLSPDTVDFVFPLQKKLSFTPGQYLEWTLPHEKSDSRGNRRYFTVASSPTEDTLRIGVKFYEPSSSFKKNLLGMGADSTVAVGQLAGDFTLSRNPAEKYVFMAGGIGITPFRSIIKYLLDTRQYRDIVLMYSNRRVEEVVYKGIFDEAKKELGIKAIYTLTDAVAAPHDWPGQLGRIDAKMIQELVPDYRERIFYISGPHAMVTAYEEVLEKMGIKKDRIKVDYFPGFA